MTLNRKRQRDNKANDNMNNIQHKKNMTFNNINNINIKDNINNNFYIFQNNQVSDLKNNQIENNNLQNKEKEISNLKKELNNAKHIIEQQKNTINNLHNQINNIYSNNSRSMEIYENIIKKKDKELSDLKLELENIKSKNKAYSDKSKIMTIDFAFSEPKKHFSVPCIDTELFAEVEEKLYKQFPEYRESNNNFMANGKTILRFKTIGQNNIENGLSVNMVIP